DGTGTFDPQSLPVGGPYTITYTYTDPLTGCTNSSSQTTYVLALPEAFISGSSTICIGGTGSLSVDFTGTGPYDFTYTDGVASNTLFGITDDPYSLSVSPIVSSNYTISSVTDDYGCSDAGTGTGSVIVNPEVQITVHPVDQTVCSGDNINFSVTATGVGLSYQWNFDGNPIIGETNDILLLNGIADTDDGSYTCVVSSTCGGPLTSNPGILTVRSETTVTLEASDAIACEESSVNFTINASGDNLFYAWEKNSNPIANGGDISGATSNNLVIINLDLTDAAVYSCVVTGTCGTATSDPATLTVEELIDITSQPSDKQECPGNNTSFSVAATGTNPAYQWQIDNVNIDGETNPTLSFTNVDSNDDANYKCIITGSCNTVSSSVAILTIWDEVSITANPVSVGTCENNTADFNVVASGSNLAYQWQLDGGILVDDAKISGSDGANLSIINLAPADEGGYACLVSNACGTLTSTTAVLTVDEGIIITTQPQDIAACPGDVSIFSLTATGTNMDYLWYKGGAPMAAETSNSLTITGPVAGDVDAYYCQISNSCGSKTSNTVNLVLNTTTSINSQPVSDTECEGGNSSFVFSVNGSNLVFQWDKDGNPLADGGSLTGTDNSNLLISNMVLTDDGIYTCEVTGSCGDVTSDPATLTVEELIVITNPPTSKQECPGNNTSFSVAVTGTNPTYQWQKDNVDIDGETNPTLSLNDVDSNDDANYKCIITGSCNTVTSALATLTIWEEVSITANPANVETCEGNIADFNVTASGSNMTYQWQLDGGNLVEGGDISGSDGANLTISNIVAA
ncbi:MAG: hypothetical protein KAS71_11210, partial [Bacteroidales bacterium]|nr:hypothetical protein [Bacteroidales bacterium]